MDKLNELYTKYEEGLNSKDFHIINLTKQLEEQKTTYWNTLKGIENLRQQCQQAEQYYRLVEDLTKENFHLKSKINTASTASIPLFSSNSENILDGK